MISYLSLFLGDYSKCFSLEVGLNSLGLTFYYNLQIVNDFFDTYMVGSDETEKVSLLFRFIQYIERQVVLFDAIEDAGFPYVNNMHGRGTLRNIKEEANNKQLSEVLSEYIKRVKVRIVLTAHPTQFYPDNVLVIINELSSAIANDELDNIKKLLVQLGKTPFYKKEKVNPSGTLNSGSSHPNS